MVTNAFKKSIALLCYQICNKIRWKISVRGKFQISGIKKTQHQITAHKQQNKANNRFIFCEKFLQILNLVFNKNTGFVFGFCTRFKILLPKHIN
jgi:hypothetical protein